MKTTYTKVASLAATIITFGSLVGGAHAATIINGSLTAADGMEGVLPSGWAVTTFTPDTINPINNTPFGGIYFSGASSDGGTFVGGTSNGASTREGFTQNVTGLVSGQQYAVSFEQQLSIHPDFDDAGFWIVSLGAQSLNSDAMTISGMWGNQSLVFTATAATQALTFRSEKVVPASSGNSYLAIDGISLTQVPEPSSVLLFGLSGIGLVFRRSRR